MAHVPNGVVTFLFTDIEGSTRLWERDAGQMWSALEQHNAILSDAIATNRGFHFKTIGDAYQAAFADPIDALRATRDAQLRLAAAQWGETGPIRVRMALHLGPAEPVNGDYLAPCLNRLSRLLSTGYGAQVLISDAVRSRIANHLPAGVALRDLGVHRLRDLLEPEPVTQVVIDGVPDTFPPLKSLEGHPTNLPIQPNPLVGREHELSTLSELLTHEEHRLVTLTGFGGTGKTRLALQAGAELVDAFFDGVFFVDLASVASAELVIPTIASTLGVRESGGLSLNEALLAWLNGKDVLLILDNMEHVLPAATDVAQLLERCDRIRILATSRTRLNIRAERELRVDPLRLPSPSRPVSEIARNDAVALFVQRARSASPGFALTDDTAATVASICHRLDGIPLAIELAASRIRTLSPAALLERLHRRLDLLTSSTQDLPPRQRTLRATIEWSHGLLPAAHRDAFNRLAVFSGGFSIDAAEAVTSGTNLDTLDVLTSLIDRSLIRRVPDHDDVERFTMLETLREYGLEQLQRSGQEDDVRAAHAAWAIKLAERARGEITGPDQTTWLARLELEHDNMRSALAWTNTPQRQEEHLRLVAAFARFWIIRGHFTEGRRWVNDAIEAAGSQITSPTLLQLTNEAGSFAFAQGQFHAARTLYERALKGARATANREMEASLCNNLGNTTLRLSDPVSAASWYEESLNISTELGDDFRRAITLGNLGTIAHYRGDVDGAIARYVECLTLWRQLENRQGEVPMLLNLLLLLGPQRPYADRARAYGERCLALARELGDRWNEALAMMGMGLIDDASGDYEQALEQFTRSLELLRGVGAFDGIGTVLGYIAVVELDRGDIARGTDILLDKLASDLEEHDLDGIQFSLEGLALAALANGVPRLAAVTFGAAEMIREGIDIPLAFACRYRHERALEQLGAALAGNLRAAWDEGRQRSLDDVVADLQSTLGATSLPDEATPRDQLLADLDTLLESPLPPPDLPPTTQPRA